MKRVRKALPVFLLAGLFLAPACNLKLVPDADKDEEEWVVTSTGERRKKRAGSTDLGVATFPGDALSKPIDHPWRATSLKPSKYQIAYAISDDEQKAVADAYHEFAKSVGHARTGENTFRWRPGALRCFGGLHCVYESLEQQGRASIEPLADLFRRYGKARGLDSIKLTRLVITFAQEIKYRIPKEEPFGVMPPALVVAKMNGDCDSKSLLAHMILRSLGVRSMLISSTAHAHTMLGVALPVGGKSFTHDGTKYAFVELTAKNSPLGHINSNLLTPNDWKAQPMEYPDDARKKKAGGYTLRGGRIRIN